MRAEVDANAAGGLMHAGTEFEQARAQSFHSGPGAGALRVVDMSSVTLSSTYINTHSELFQHILRDEEEKGLQDLNAMYLPRGPIKKLVTYFRAGGGMPFYVGHSEYYDFDNVVAKLTQLPSLTTGFRDSMFGGGKGHDIPGMFVSGVGETYERAMSALAFFDMYDTITYATYSTLKSKGVKCVGPDELRLFADEQYDSIVYEKFEENTFLGWMQGKRLLSEQPTWVPAQLVLPFYKLHPQERLIGYATTGGLACHISEKEAMFHGILELIERDAANVRWNCHAAPEPIELDTEPSNPTLHRLLKVAETLPTKFRFYLHRTDITDVQVVTVIGFAPGFNKYSYYAGSGVGFDIEEAMLYALNEYGQAEATLQAIVLAPTWNMAISAKHLFSIDPDVPVRKIDHFFKIVPYYGHLSNAKKLDWYLNNGRPVELSSLPRAGTHDSIDDRFNRLLGILRKLKIDPITFNFTPSQVPTLRLTKVFISELCPPYVQALPLLGNRRYYDLPVKLGWADKRLTYNDLTADPHPYP